MKLKLKLSQRKKSERILKQLQRLGRMDEMVWARAQGEKKKKKGMEGLNTPDEKKKKKI